MQYLSYVIIVILILVFVSFNFADTSNELANYVLRSTYHADMSHLVANLISFYGLSYMETIIGPRQFLSAIIFIWIASSVILYLIHIMFPSRKVTTVGFSGVIFGLIVVYYSVLNQGAAIPGLIISIIPQLFATGISFEGHLSGIIAGIIYVFFFLR